MEGKGYWLSGTKANVGEVQRIPESACVYAQVVWVGLQLAGLRDTWKDLAEDGVSLEFWLQD